MLTHAEKEGHQRQGKGTYPLQEVRSDTRSSPPSLKPNRRNRLTSPPPCFSDTPSKTTPYLNRGGERTQNTEKGNTKREDYEAAKTEEQNRKGGGAERQKGFRPPKTAERLGFGLRDGREDFWRREIK